MANFPALNRGATQSVPDGEVFWFITTGSVSNGMPSWATLPEQARWQLVTYLKSLKSSGQPQRAQTATGSPLATNAPFDRLGVPGIALKGKVLNAGGMRTLAVEGLAP